MDVSIIIPCSANHRKYLRELFEGLLNQSYRGLREILLVMEEADGKDVEEIREDSGARILFSNAKSPSINRNIALREATGGIVVFIDSDCIPKENWLENLLKPLDKFEGSQGIDYSYDDTYLGKFMEKQQLEYLRNSVDGGFCRFIDTRNCAVRMDALKKVGFFDEKLETSEDRDLGYRLFKAGCRVVLNKDAVVLHRWKKGSLWGFFKWGLWYGKGDYIFSRKWPDLGGGGLGSVLRDIRSSFFYGVIAIRKAGDEREVNLLFAARQVGVACGKLRAMLLRA